MNTSSLPPPSVTQIAEMSSSVKKGNDAEPSELPLNRQEIEDILISRYFSGAKLEPQWWRDPRHPEAHRVTIGLQDGNILYAYYFPSGINGDPTDKVLFEVFLLFMTWERVRSLVPVLVREFHEWDLREPFDEAEDKAELVELIELLFLRTHGYSSSALTVEPIHSLDTSANESGSAVSTATIGGRPSTGIQDNDFGSSRRDSVPPTSHGGIYEDPKPFSTAENQLAKHNESCVQFTQCARNLGDSPANPIVLDDLPELKPNASSDSTISPKLPKSEKSTASPGILGKRSRDEGPEVPEESSKRRHTQHETTEQKLLRVESEEVVPQPPYPASLPIANRESSQTVVAVTPAAPSSHSPITLFFATHSALPNDIAKELSSDKDPRVTQQMEARMKAREEVLQTLMQEQFRDLVKTHSRDEAMEILVRVLKERFAAVTEPR